MYFSNVRFPHIETIPVWAHVRTPFPYPSSGDSLHLLLFLLCYSFFFPIFQESSSIFASLPIFSFALFQVTSPVETINHWSEHIFLSFLNIPHVSSRFSWKNTGISPGFREKSSIYHRNLPHQRCLRATAVPHRLRAVRMSLPAASARPLWWGKFPHQ